MLNKDLNYLRMPTKTLGTVEKYNYLYIKLKLKVEPSLTSQIAEETRSLLTLCYAPIVVVSLNSYTVTTKVR